MKKLLLSLCIVVLSAFMSVAESWSYTVVKGSYAKHDYSQVKIGEKSNIVFNKGENNEQVWQILVTAIDTSNAPTFSNDGSNTPGILIGAAAKPPKSIALFSDINFEGHTITKVSVQVAGGATKNCSYDASLKIGDSFSDTKANVVTSSTQTTTVEWEPNVSGEILVEFSNNTTAVGKGKNAGLKICSVTVEYTNSIITPEPTKPSMTITAGAQTFENDGEYSISEGSVVNITAKGATSISIVDTDNDVDINVVGENATWTPVAGDYMPVVTATNEAGSTEVTFLLTVTAPKKTADISYAEGTEVKGFAQTTSKSVPLLKNDHNLPVTFSSSDSNIAEASADAIYFYNEGTATITATFNGNDEFEAASASYTVTVLPGLGAITVNGKVAEASATISFYEGTAITFAAENAEELSVYILNSEAVEVVSTGVLNGSSYTWTPEALDEYEVSVTAKGCEKEDEKSFTIVVTEKPESAITGLWKKVTSLDALNDVTPYILAGTNEGNWYAFNGEWDNNLKATEVETHNDYIVFEDESGVISIAKEGNFYTMFAAQAKTGEEISGGYLNCESSSNKNYLRLSTEAVDASNITLTANSDGSWNGTFKTSTTTSSTRKNLRFNFNNGTPLFNCYGSGQEPFYIYEPLNEALEGVLYEGEDAVDHDTEFHIEYQKPRLVTIKLAPKHKAYWHYEEATTSADEPKSIKAQAEAEKVFNEYNEAEPIELTEAGTLTFYTTFGKHKSAEKVLNVTGSATTSLTEIEGAQNAASEWYDLQGRRVARPAKGGVYIRKQGSAITKLAL